MIMSATPGARFAVNAPEIVHQTIDGEVVIINLARGFYYSLQSTGALIWDALAAGTSTGEVVDDLCRRFAGARAAMADAVDRLVAELEAEGLIAPRPDEEATAAPAAASARAAAGARPAFEAPVLQKYSDMQELLLLDPIHEVDDSGWPGPDPGRKPPR
jgi:hypothetical protein